MNSTVNALLTSRKFWTGTLSMAAVFAAVLLRSLNLIPADALIPTIVAITTTALGFIGATAWEDVADKKANAPAALPQNTTTTNVTNVSQPQPPTTP